MWSKDGLGTRVCGVKIDQELGSVDGHKHRMFVVSIL